MAPNCWACGRQSKRQNEEDGGWGGGGVIEVALNVVNVAVGAKQAAGWSAYPVGFSHWRNHLCSGIYREWSQKEEFRIRILENTATLVWRKIPRGCHENYER